MLLYYFNNERLKTFERSKTNWQVIGRKAIVTCQDKKNFVTGKTNRWKALEPKTRIHALVRGTSM